MNSIYKILEKIDDGILVETKDGQVKKLVNIHVPNWAKQGNYIRFTEHIFYDVVDENGKLFFPK